jgi:hypothetical protein
MSVAYPPHRSAEPGIGEEDTYNASGKGPMETLQLVVASSASVRFVCHLSFLSSF